MEARHDLLPEKSPDGTALTRAEVVLLNGSQAGSHWVLTSPLTLIGQASNCDIRFNVEEAQPLHCALVIGPRGPILRALQEVSPTYVNDEPIAVCELRADDVVTVGSSCFHVRWSAAPEAEATLRKQEALRIQAAAVAAEQSALTEEEIRLQQRRLGLAQQEKQLSALLEERQQRLAALRDETKQAQAVLGNERAAYEKRAALVLSDLTRKRREVNENQRQNQVERKRLLTLRQRLKRRWHRQWAAEREAMRRREALVADERRKLQAARDRHQEEVAKFTRRQLRSNAETELTRRHLRIDRKLLCKRRDEFREGERHLKQRESALNAADQSLHQAKQQWQALHGERRREIGGLESRITNHREKIAEQEQEVLRLEETLRNRTSRVHAPARELLPVQPLAQANPVTVPATENAGLAERDWQLGQAEDALRSRLTELQRMAGDLTDQRVHLAEACERFAQARLRWERQREQAVTEIEALVRRLRAREQTLQMREQAFEASEHNLGERAGEIAKQQRHFEATRAKLAAEVSNWESQRERLLVEVRGKENLLEENINLVSQLRQRWDIRRREQIGWLRGKRAACEELRRQCNALQEDWQRRHAELLQEQQSLAEQILALEEYRLERAGEAADPAAAGKRLDHLRRRWNALSTALKDAHAQQRRQWESDKQHLDEQLRHLHAREHEINSQDADLSNRQAAFEQQQVLAQLEQAKLLQQVQTQRRQREVYEQQLRELNDEVERLARLLLDGTESHAIAKGQAA